MKYVPTAPSKNGLWTGIVHELRHGHTLIAAVSALLVAAVNLEVFIEQQWQLATFTIVLGVLSGGAFIVARQPRCEWPRIVRRASAAAFLLTVPLSLTGYALFVGGRLYESGPIIAVARFDGPPLPDPYGQCRPSDMLADALADVQQRYRRITAFELPYAIDPNGRWADMRAASHGFVQGADALVYGEYSLVGDSAHDGAADRVLISPNVDRVPLSLSLGPNNTPLLEWTFPTRVVAIDRLCRGDAERFLNDGRRLTLALTSIELIAAQNYDAAQAALREAENSDPPLADTLQERRYSRCDLSPANPYAECSGVLAFYLGVINERFAHYALARKEFAYAAGRLHRAAPHIDLGELLVKLGEREPALAEFRQAVSANPFSVSALATLARYEYSYGDEAAASDDLRFARALPQRTPYDGLALSRALFDGGDENDKRAALAMLKDILDPPLLGSHLPLGLRLDAEVDYGRRLASVEPAHYASTAVRATFEDVVRQCPFHIAANYQLGLALKALREQTPPGADAARRDLADASKRAFRTAVDAPAFTDDEFVNAGNAAFELGAFDHNAFDVATQRYKTAIALNAGAVYAFSGLAEIHKHARRFRIALADMRRAAELHPREELLKTQLESIEIAANRSVATIGEGGHRPR